MCFLDTTIELVSSLVEAWYRVADTSSVNQESEHPNIIAFNFCLP